MNEQAEEHLQFLIRSMAKTEGVTENLKAADPMEWVGRMNNIRSQAEGIVLNAIIYV